MEWINKFTENIIYKRIFWGLAFIISVTSYIVKKYHEKYCNLYTEIIRIIHHFITVLLYFGVFAPIDSLIYVFLLSICAVCSWVFANNTCVLTTIERIECGYKKSYRFDSIHWCKSEQMDKFILQYRKVILFFINIVIGARLVEYYKLL